MREEAAVGKGQLTKGPKYQVWGLGTYLGCSQLGRYSQSQCWKPGDSMEAELEQQFPAWVWIRIIEPAHKTHLEPTLKVCDSARLERDPGICILTFSMGFRDESSLKKHQYSNPEGEKQQGD